MPNTVVFASPPRIEADLKMCPNTVMRADIASLYGVPNGATAAILGVSFVGTDGQPGRLAMIQYHNSTTADNALGNATPCQTGWADSDTGLVKLNYENGLPGSVFICCPSWVGGPVRVWLDLQGYVI